MNTQTKPLPPQVRGQINQLAHRLALAAEITIRDRLMAQACAAAMAGHSLDAVLAPFQDEYTRGNEEDQLASFWNDEIGEHVQPPVRVKQKSAELGRVRAAIQIIRQTKL